MNDPTQGDNLPSIFIRSDTIVTKVITNVQVFPAGTFYNRQGVNATGQLVYISPWASGAVSTSGPINGY